VVKRPKSGTKSKGKTARKAAKPVHNEANIDEFQREGMGVAPKE
jgi:hypothetical protein